MSYRYHERHTTKLTLIIAAGVFLGFIVGILPVAAAPIYNVQALAGFSGRIPRNATAINNSGEVVGDSSCSGCFSHAFVGTTDLILPGDQDSIANDINDSGQVVGYSSGLSGARAFLFSSGTMTDLSVLVGDPSVAYGINNSCQIVGSAYLGSRPDAFLLSGGSLTLLHSPGGEPAYRINDLGLIAGTGWVYIAGVMKPLLFPNGTYSMPNGINNLGQVVGYADNINGHERLFLYSAGTLSDLGFLGTANGINNAGIIVGTSSQSGQARAIVYANGTVTDLNSSIPANSNWILEAASDIDDAGVIVGSGQFNGVFQAFQLTPVSPTGPPPVHINPVPVLSSLSPSGAVVGGPDFTMTVNGCGFVSGAAIGWNGTITPTTFVSNTQLTAPIPATEIASAATAQVSVSNPLPGGGTSNVLAFTINPPPIVTPGGTVNGASFAAGAPVAPGSIISIFGSNLANAALSASSTPLPTELLTTSATINEVPVPLYYVGPTQINAQVPFETQPGTATLVVTANGASSPAVTFAVAATAPGIFLYDSNRAVAVNPDGSINASNDPAEPGAVIVVYMTGQGAVSNPTPDGAPALGSPFPETLATTTATIGATNAKVLFSGLASGFVGLLQVNIQIPNLAAGDQPLVVTIGGAASNSALITVASQ